MKDQIYKPKRLDKNNMKRLIILLSLVVLISVIPFTFALIQPTQQTNRLFLNPFYRISMTSNTNYTYAITINPPDKVSSVSSAIIQIETYLSPTVNYDLWVNGKVCNNPRFTVSTTYAGASQGTLYFDCSNVITGAGVYTVTLRADKNSGASTAWIDLTYSNKPRGDLTLHGTEYTNKQTAKVWLQLIDSLGEYVNDGVCYADIYTPDGDELVEYIKMVNMERDGIYYLNYDLTDLAEGVYPAIGRCFYQAIQTFNFALSYFIEIGSYNAGTVGNTYVIDNSFLRFRESTINPVRNISVGLNFTNGTVCTNISEDLLTGITIRTVTRFDSVVNDDITIYVWNYTSNSWIQLSNKALEGNVWRDVSNSLIFNNITTAGLVNSSGSNLKIRFNDTNLTDGATDDFDIDYASVSCDQLANPEWQEVKGSSEIHISATGDDKYVTETLCGENPPESTESSCAVFVSNLSYWNTTWGHIYDKVTFYNSYQADIDEIEVYETQLGQDCTALIDITETRNGNTISILDNVTLASGSKGNCLISIPVIFNMTENDFFVEITQENYMKWEVQRINDLVRYYRMPIESFCAGIETASGNPFQIPIAGGNDVSTLYASNPIYLGCYRSIDDLYWFDYYYDNSLPINVSGNYESYLYNIRLYYEELKDGSDAVGSIIGQNVLVHVHTLCGSSSHYTEGYSCAKIMPPDDYFTSQEGYILQNLTVFNDFNTTSIGYYSYRTAPAVDCSAVMEIIKDNGTRTDIIDEVLFTAGSEGSCSMNIPINNVQGVPSYQIELYIENYILWDIYWARDLVNSLNDTITLFCNDLAINRSITYVLPVNQSIEAYRNDSELYFCYRAVDDLYWWYFFYDKLQTSNFTQVGELGSYRYESEFFWIRIFDDYNTIKAYERNLNQVQTLNEILDLKETLANRVWNFNGSRNLTYYGEGIDPSLISDYVWNSTNRSLTYTDNIAYAIWNYSGVLGANVIQTLVNATWSYSGNISINLASQLGNATWAYTGNSTYMVNSIVNNTWEYTGGRYIHGEIVEG